MKPPVRLNWGLFLFFCPERKIDPFEEMFVISSIGEAFVEPIQANWLMMQQAALEKFRCFQLKKEI
jgi:hypothetical protein